MGIQKNISASLLYQIGITGLNFITTIFITRIIGADGRGDVAIYNNAVMIATTVCGLSLGSALVYFIASKKIDLQQAFSIIGVVAIGALITVSAVCVIIYALGLGNSITPFYTSGIALMLFVWHVIITIININITAMMNAKNKFIFPLQLQFYIAIALLLFFVIVQIYSSTAIYTTFSILAFVAFYSVQTIIVLWYAMHSYQLSFFKIKVDNIVAKQLLAFGGMAFACNIVQLLSYRIDVWFLHYYHTASIVGVYSIATLCIQLLWILPNQFATVLYTKFNQHQQSPTIIAMVTNITASVFWLCLLLFTAVFLCGCIGIPLLFGVQFGDSAKLLGILLIGAVPIASAIMISTYNASANRLAINLQGSLLGLLFCIVFNFLLIPTYGYYGAAIASVIAYVSNCIYLYWQFCSANGINLKAILIPDVQYLKHLKTHWHAL